MVSGTNVLERITNGFTTKQWLDSKRFVFGPAFRACSKPLTALVLIKGYGLDLNRALALADTVDDTDTAASSELAGF
jgi:hypothetical protein